MEGGEKGGEEAVAWVGSAVAGLHPTGSSSEGLLPARSMSWWSYGRSEE
jgi:hypothetical protein